MGTGVVYLCNAFGAPDSDRCEALLREGFDVSIVDWREAKQEYVWDSYNGACPIRSFAAPPTGIGRLFAVLQLLMTVALDRRSCVLVYGYQKVPFFLSALASRCLGKRCIALYDSKFNDYPRRIVGDVIKTVFLRPYNAIFSASLASTEYLRYMGFSNVREYWCAIDVANFRKLVGVPTPAIDSSQRPFVAIARYIPKKNLFGVLDAFEKYCAKVECPRKLMLCGYGPLEDQLRDYVGKSAVLTKFVEITGYRSRMEVARILSEAFALLLLSTEEQYGIVVSEAFALGIPAVVSDRCGAADLVRSGINGYVVRVDEIEYVAQLMVRMHSDNLMWNSLSRGAASSADKVDVGQFVELCREVVSV